MKKTLNEQETAFMRERIKLLDFQVHEAINAAKIEAFQLAIQYMQQEIAKLKASKWSGK